MFELLDVSGRQLAAADARLSEYVGDQRDATVHNGSLRGAVHQLPDYGGFAGSVQWRPALPGYGFYHRTRDYIRFFKIFQGVRMNLG